MVSLRCPPTWATAAALPTRLSDPTSNTLYGAPFATEAQSAHPIDLIWPRRYRR
jgi:hypothetical protein